MYSASDWLNGIANAYLVCFGGYVAIKGQGFVRWAALVLVISSSLVLWRLANPVPSKASSHS